MNVHNLLHGFKMASLKYVSETQSLINTVSNQLNHSYSGMKNQYILCANHNASA